MVEQMEIGDVAVDVLRKDIKNVHLSVHPPTGRVRISAPARMSLATIRVFAVTKLGWIKKHQRKVRDQERESPRDYIERESHYVWGRRCLLIVQESKRVPSVELSPNRIVLSIRPTTDQVRKQAIMDEWYRRQVKEAAPPLIAKWEPLMGVKVERLFVQRMKTRWGGCKPATRTIRLNTDLAKKPPGCLEYLVVHEMAHLLEPTHNARFVALMDSFLPRWRSLRDELNRLPVRHENWTY
jgi:predicted metal-dependent hydrolase